MSTRYVWGRFNFSPEYKLSDDYCPVGRYEDGGTSIATGPMSSTTTLLYMATSLTMSYSNDSGAVARINDEDYDLINYQYGNETIPARMYFKCGINSANEKSLSPIYYAETSCNIRGQTFENNYGNDYKGIFLYSGNAKEVIPYTQKGSKVSDVSGTSQSSYPSDGVQGSYWYTYQGSDNIDPSACSIPSTINGGTAITITVTPGSGKVYGGTVSYQYQVNLAGAGWTTIATTSATTRSYTVPYGTASIQVRVRAQDNIGFTSSTYVTSSSVTVINNQPPTAPGSIDVTGVVAGQQATITLTAATDPDGTIASYIYERSVDGSAWTQIANVNSLTQTDQVSADWGTVAYRACAVDDDGASGPYVTSSTTVVNSGWVIISGPAADMGDKPAPFNFVFSVSVTGQASVDAINAAVTLDGESIYTGTPNSGVEVSIPIDTRLLAAGEHTVEVQATKESYLEASGSYTFDVPAITLPDGGRAEQLQNPNGDVVFPYTLARLVIGEDGKDINELLAAGVKIQAGSYTGTGTYGSSNPNNLTFEFEPKMVIIVSNNSRNIAMPYIWGTEYFTSIESSASVGSGGGSITITNNIASVDKNKMTWYSNTADRRQFNSAGIVYNYFAIG